MSGIVTAGLSPAIQKIIRLPELITGDVNRSTDYLIDAAGKSINVGRVLTQAGQDVCCLIPLGEESTGSYLSLCRRDGLDVRPVPVAGRMRTAYTLVDMGAGVATEVVVNEPEVITPEEEERFKREYLRILDKVPTAVTLSGSRLPGFSNEIVPFMVEAAVERGVLFFADYKGEDLANSFISVALRPDYVKINEDELFQTFPETERAGTEKGIQKLAEKYGCSFIITRGVGSTLFAGGSEAGELASQMVEAVSPIGCGDSFLAGLTEGIVSGLALTEAVEKGRQYASWNAESYHPGWIKDGLKK